MQSRRPRSALPRLLFGLLTLLAAGPTLGVTPSVSIGEGPSSIVELDSQLRPLRRWVGLDRPSDVTVLDDGGLLVADQGTHEVIALDAGGAVLWREHFPTGVQRARPRPAGGLVVTSIDQVLLTDVARQVVRTVPLPGVRVALELPNGALLAVYNQGQGWLVEIAPDGSVAWRSQPRAADGAETRPGEVPTFLSVAALDAGADGSIFLTDFDAHTLLLLDREGRLQESWRLLVGGHWSDTKMGPGGELVMTAPETAAFAVQSPGTTQRSWKSTTTELPMCADVGPGGTIFVGLWNRPEKERLSATARRAAARTPRAFHRTLPGAAVLGGAIALLIGIALRWADRRQEMPAGGATADPALDAGAAVQSAPATRRVAHPALFIAWLVVLAAALTFAVKFAGEIPPGAGLRDLSWFAAACAAAAIALRVLNAMRGVSATLSSLTSQRWKSEPGASERHDGRFATARTGLLVMLAVASAVASAEVVRLRPEAQPLAVGAWVAAQVLLLAAAFVPTPAFRAAGSRRWGALLRRWWIPALLVAGAAVLRLWQLGWLPDAVHWDHGMYGNSALRLLRGESGPFFTMDGNLPKPGMAWWAALFAVFGAHYWVIRLTGALSGILLVLGVYLLGTALFNRRVGAAAAALAAVNHVLLIYSRQPYVLEPAPWFVFSLYFAVLGLQRGRRLHFCLSGLCAGWMMLTYWGATALAGVAAVLFAGFAIAQPRWFARRIAGLGWLIVGGLVVYLPMLPSMTGRSRLGERMREQFALFDASGALRVDPDFWAAQLRGVFGTILAHGEQSPWGVASGSPITIGPEAALLGVGVFYLLLSGFALPTIAILIWGAVGFALGGAVFIDPRVAYHFLGSIPPVLLAVAIAIDRLAALTDPWSSRMTRAVPRLAMTLLLAYLATPHLRAAWTVVRRPAAPGGGSVLHADVRSLVPRFVREHPDYRYYLLRDSTGLSSDAPSFVFFADDSDISDVTGGVDRILPVPATPHARGAAFVVLPERAVDAAALRETYPDARRETIVGDNTRGTVEVYLVDAETVRRTYESSGGAAAPGDAPAPPAASDS